MVGAILVAIVSRCRRFGKIYKILYLYNQEAKVAISKKDLKDLKRAKELLDNPSLVARLTDALGSPIEKGFELLPAKWSDIVNLAAKESLTKALEITVKTIGDKPKVPSSNKIHKTLVMLTGGAGGFFGLPALTVELPVSTMIILRSISDIARSEGENIKKIESKMSCLGVFALGGKSEKDNATESGYYAVRLILSRQIPEVIKNITAKSTTEGIAPAIARYISSIASRFAINISEKVAAQAVPILGAAGGALINMIFIDHFQDMARGHFIVRRLDRKYGSDVVQREYKKI